MTTNGTAPALVNPEITLTISLVPATGQVKVSFPQIDLVGILGLLEMAKVVLMEQRAKADQRVTIPDLQVTKRLIT